MIANALRRLLAEAERANETWLKEAGQGLIDVSAINEARAALSASSYHLMVAAVDAAMVEMRNISPPLRRSECERLIRAALGFAQQATQPAEVTDERIDDVIKRHWGDACITIESIRQFARAILALRPVQSGLTGCNCRWDGDTQVQWCELHLAHKEAIHEWAERAKSAEQKLALRPEQVPMTDERSVTVKVDRELFSFHSEQDWVNKARSRYANCGVQKGHYITVDAAGHVMHMGLCFKHAAYPVTVYQLQTNWPKEQA